eukprot:15193246-Alexandrium_andersonii.AAC.1
MLSLSAARPPRMARTCATGSAGSLACVPPDALKVLGAGMAREPPLSPRALLSASGSLPT